MEKNKKTMTQNVILPAVDDVLDIKIKIMAEEKELATKQEKLAAIERLIALLQQNDEQESQSHDEALLQSIDTDFHLPA